MVWRDLGEPAVELHTLMDCLEHAGRGGIRAGALAFTLRSGFNIFVLLFRIWKLPRQFRFSLIRHALFGQDSLRFAAMIGSFVSLYKFILNSLPIVTPPPPIDTPFAPNSPDSDDLESNPITMAPTPADRRRGRLSFRAQAHEVWVRKQTRRWHAILAGAVAGGFGVLFEKKGRRVVISQQLFVRGLQGSYNAFTERRGIHVPYGAVFAFSLACGQIMYAFLMRPDTIPPSYSTWIQNASKVSKETVSMNRSLVRVGRFDVADVEALMNREDATPSNRAALAALIAQAASTGDFGTRFASCPAVHPWIDHCTDVTLDRFLTVVKWMFPIYGALHFIPMILFKRKLFIEQPSHMLLRAGWGTNVTQGNESTWGRSVAIRCISLHLDE
ncbi:hypothetical protein BD410DRAFT_65350 [Rickenella mellea]|uniref:Uncharacterized protein n=1 Tax=Rickenella mellea TaxID=50990 RepID=A0A4Y7QDD3_9AGAM|nr:hypothetical protein BD410DRAFT_65350 [Rickenella mellea]